jgi:hypothetical protein
VVADHKCACAFGDAERVANVVSVTMTDKDKFRLDLIRRRRGSRIFSKEWVYHQFVRVGFQTKGSVPVPSQSVHFLVSFSVSYHPFPSNLSMHLISMLQSKSVASAFEVVVYRLNLSYRELSSSHHLNFLRVHQD